MALVAFTFGYNKGSTTKSATTVSMKARRSTFQNAATSASEVTVKRIKGASVKALAIRSTTSESSLPNGFEIRETGTLGQTIWKRKDKNTSWTMYYPRAQVHDELGAKVSGATTEYIINRPLEMYVPGWTGTNLARIDVVVYLEVEDYEG